MQQITLYEPSTIQLDVERINTKSSSISLEHGMKSSTVLERKNEVFQTRQRSPQHSPVDFMSSIIMDTTSQHQKHIFDLNCKICTGRVPVPDAGPIRSSKPLEELSKDIVKRIDTPISYVASGLKTTQDNSDDISDKLYWGSLSTISANITPGLVVKNLLIKRSTL